MNFQNLVDYCQDFGVEDVMSGVSVPEPLIVEDVKSAIMVKCGLLAPVYSDPDTMRNMIKFWFNSHRWNIDHLIKIILADYSPIENYDRYEISSITRNNTETNSGNDINTTSGTDINEQSGTDINEQSGTDIYTNGKSIENKVSAYNTNTYSNNSIDVYSGNDMTDYGKAESVTYGKTESVTYGKVDNLQHGKITSNSGNESSNNHLHGNIGVTTNQQMIESELKLLKEFNIYEWIASRIEDDLFITVY